MNLTSNIIEKLKFVPNISDVMKEKMFRVFVFIPPSPLFLIKKFLRIRKKNNIYS